MDCLDRTWSDIPWPKAHVTGNGHYPKSFAPRPSALSGMPSRYGRYGREPGVVREALRHLSPLPDLILVTTAMTYRYPGATEAVTMVRSIW